MIGQLFPYVGEQMAYIGSPAVYTKTILQKWGVCSLICWLSFMFTLVNKYITSCVFLTSLQHFFVIVVHHSANLALHRINRLCPVLECISFLSLHAKVFSPSFYIFNLYCKYTELRVLLSDLCVFWHLSYIPILFISGFLIICVYLANLYVDN